MTSFRRAVCTAAAAALLAGCGGSRGSSPVPPARATAGQSARSVAAPPLAGTLYAAESTTVHAYPLGADGSTAPDRTIFVHPYQSHYIRGLAVNADKTLAVLDDYRVSAGFNDLTVYCRVVLESATASGLVAALGNYPCDPVDAAHAYGIAVNTSGGYDVLFFDDALEVEVVRRFGDDGASVVNTLVLQSLPSYIGTDRGAHDYLGDSSGNFTSYKTATTDPAAPATSVTFTGVTALGPIAVSPGADRTAYVAEADARGQNVYAVAPGASAPSRVIGPFTNNAITAMAVDSQGSLYVALIPLAGGLGSTIRVYDSAADGKPTPLRIIRPNPRAGYIQGLAVSE